MLHELMSVLNLAVCDSCCNVKFTLDYSNSSGAIVCVCNVIRNLPDLLLYDEYCS